MPKARDLPRFEQMQSSEMAHRSLEGMARKLATAGAGSRNNLLNWAAYTVGTLIRQGKLSSVLADQRLTQAALAAGLTLPEIKATIASGFRAGAGAE